MMLLKENEVMVKGHDYIYRIAMIYEEKVVYDHKNKMFFEYVGDTYLDPGDEVVTAKVVN